MSEQIAESAGELVLDSAPKKQFSVGWAIELIRESWGLTPSHSGMVQLVRSLVVSAVALVADFGALVVLKEALGFHYLLAAGLSFGLGVVVNYVLSVRWVFADRQLANRRAEFVFFVVICGIGLALNLAIIAGMVQIVRVDYRLAKAVSTVLVFFWNFFARKKFLY